jgi:hypothetical protein
MRKARWIAVTALLALATTLGCAALYGAWRHVPDFYRQALVSDDQAQASDELLQHASALVSDARRDGQWKALFSARQINGWLAVDVPKNHSSLLSHGVHEPRVAIEQDRLQLGFRYGQGPLSAVCTVSIGVRCVQTNTVALRVEKVRGGLLPLPIGYVLNTLSEQARRARLPVEWRRIGDDPVAIVRLVPLEESSTSLMLGNLELSADELFIAGLTQRSPVAARMPAEPGAATENTSSLETPVRRR